MRFTLSALLLGFLLDLALGDPRWLYHPIRLVGHLITGTERVLRGLFPETKKGELAAGALLVLVVAGITTAAPALILYGAGKLNQGLLFALYTLFSYQILATRSLKDESMKVYRALKAQDLKGARQAVSMIVGRDTKELDQEGVAKAAIETVAENTSDGIIAPLLFLALGGPVLGFFYKSINTMDSMVGYKNEKYLYFGRAAAKLDDVVNYLPARLSALLMIAATVFTPFDTKNAWRIYRRDHANHASPNSAHTEAVMAGALGLQLAGNACYFGKLYEKPTIGDIIKKVEAEDIRRANVLLYATALLTMVLVVLLYVGVDLGWMYVQLL
ncbi:MAG: cobalamin biosynthesis protein CobD [Lachnospiraceae bacterium]|jgi:adenosylcobinamide-phosphate synthase|nr:cobalamin biosynthesis protein CobD [Lachnospiraceae bacterium]MCI8994675.1 cobalamin biosynthesis protein CobD [Lachnospiraceae bacterium]MCI9134166.1 cobalamin biosynthesis protein CobD [Lachnospiraceae bacterium]